MKVSRRRILAAAVSTVAAATLSLGYFVPAEAATTAVSAEQRSNPIHIYSGEEMFRALMFGQGALGREIGPLAPRMMQTDEVVHVTDALTSHIEQADASFFDRFKGGVTSGQAVAVDAMLREAGAQLGSALGALGLVDESGATGPSITPRFAAVQVVLFAVAGVVVGVAAVLVTAAVATQTVMYPARSTSTASRGVALSYDRWVAEIAVSFG